MRAFFIPVVIGTAIGLGWLAVWVVALRLLGISPLTRTPEARAATRERIIRMGKARYILLFGVLGPGLALGFGNAAAIALIPGGAGWRGTVVSLVVWIVLGGCWYGVMGWNDSFRAATLFPPPFLIGRNDADHKNP